MRTSIQFGAFVLIALVHCLSAQAPAHKHHPYLQRAIERLDGSPHVAYRAEVTLSDEVAGTFVRVSGRVILEREAGTTKLAIDGTVTRAGQERGISLRSVAGRVQMCDRTAGLVTEGTHYEMLDPDANLIRSLLSSWIGHDGAALDVKAREFTFQHGEQFGGETCHLYTAPGSSLSNSYAASLLTEECSFSSSDGLPRRVLTREPLPNAEVRTRRWRMVSWESRPVFSIDPYRLDSTEEYAQVKPRSLVERRSTSREAIVIQDSLTPFIERFHASESDVKVVASVSPT